MDFKAKLEIFEGPIDLLLHLIKINEVDIADIPIATITDQYLEYLDLMKALDINVAGDFLVMASTLMYLKSKTLLPKQEQDLEEIEDLMEEIVRPIKEYMQLQEAAHELASRNMVDRDVYTRGSTVHEMGEEEPESSYVKVNLYELMNAFKKIIKRQYPDAVIKFKANPWSIKKKMVQVINMVKKEKRLFLGELFSKMQSLSEMIATFLALLELVRTGFVRIYQEKQDSDITLEALS